MIISQTSLRVGLLGGGSDIPQFFRKYGKGIVINFAIDKYVYVLVRKRHDDYIYLKYSQNEIVHVKEIDQIKHDFIRETLKFMGIDFGLEIINFADIPTKGTGLGSSSSFLVGLLNALYTLKGCQIDKRKLAEWACEIEINLCGKPIGYQDQFAAAYGGLHTYVFDVFNTEVGDFSSHVPELTDNLMLFYTGLTRESQGILSEQVHNIDSDYIYKNMIDNVKLAERGIESIVKKKYDVIGELLDENWRLKKTFSSKITSPIIDEVYSCAKENGCIGGKITGAGGGGFLILYVPRNAQDGLRNALGYNFGDGRIHLSEMPFKVDMYGTRIMLNVEQERWSV